MCRTRQQCLTASSGLAQTIKVPYWINKSTQEKDKPWQTNLLMKLSVDNLHFCLHIWDMRPHVVQAFKVDSLQAKGVTGAYSCRGLCRQLWQCWHFRTWACGRARRFVCWTGRLGGMCVTRRFLWSIWKRQEEAQFVTSKFVFECFLWDIL